MWDFIKTKSKLTAKQIHYLLNDSILKFTKTTCAHTRKLLYYESYYGPMRFRIYPNKRFTTSGSMHKFFNFLTKNESRNDDLYTYNDFITTLEFFSKALNIDTKKMRVHNIEYGFNLHLKYSAAKCLKYIYAYKWEIFERTFAEDKVYFLRKMTEYWVKIYLKGLQFGNKPNLLRIEKSVKTMRSAFNKHIYLDHLVNKSFWQYCLDDLLEMVDLIIIKDDIDSDELTNVESRVVM